MEDYKGVFKDTGYIDKNMIERTGWLNEREVVWAASVSIIFYLYYGLLYAGDYNSWQRMLLALGSSAFIIGIETYRTRFHLAALFFWIHQLCIQLELRIGGNHKITAAYYMSIIGLVICNIKVIRTAIKRGEKDNSVYGRLNLIAKPTESNFIFDAIEAILMYIGIKELAKRSIRVTDAVPMYEVYLITATIYLEVASLVLNMFAMKLATYIRMVWFVIWIVAAWFELDGIRYDILIPFLYLVTELFEEWQFGEIN